MFTILRFHHQEENSVVQFSNHITSWKYKLINWHIITASKFWPRSTRTKNLHLKKLAITHFRPAALHDCATRLRHTCYDATSYAATTLRMLRKRERLPLPIESRNISSKPCLSALDTEMLTHIPIPTYALDLFSTFLLRNGLTPFITLRWVFYLHSAKGFYVDCFVELLFSYVLTVLLSFCLK